MVGEGTERSICSRADAEVGDGLRGEVAPRRGAWAPRSRPRGSCLGLLRSVRLTCRLAGLAVGTSEQTSVAVSSDPVASCSIWSVLKRAVQHFAQENGLN